MRKTHKVNPVLAKKALGYYAEIIEKSLPGIRKSLVKPIKDMPPEDIAFKVARGLENSVPKKAKKHDFTAVTMTKACCRVGAMVMHGKVDQSLSTRAVKRQEFLVGYHLLYLLVEDNRMDFRRGRYSKDKKQYVIHERDQYMVSIRDEEFVENLLGFIRLHPFHVKTYNMPSVEGPGVFEGSYSPDLGDLIHRASPEVKAYTTMGNCEPVFRTINKNMAIPFVINRAVRG